MDFLNIRSVDDLIKQSGESQSSFLWSLEKTFGDNENWIEEILFYFDVHNRLVDKLHLKGQNKSVKNSTILQIMNELGENFQNHPDYISIALSRYDNFEVLIRELNFNQDKFVKEILNSPYIDKFIELIGNEPTEQDEIKFDEFYRH
jgi:hypothetical protein